MNKTIVLTGAILICLGIILGAFGAHSLKETIDTEGLAIFETGVKYQMYMGFGFLAVGLAADKFDFKLQWFYRLGLTGVIIFSGLLYILCFRNLYPDLKFLGAIVPIGGTLMIAAWLVFIYRLFKK